MFKPQDDGTFKMKEFEKHFEEHKQFDTYQGWANYETWNIALWIQNTEVIYNIAKQFDNYKDFVNLGLKVGDFMKTPDEVSFTDKLLNIEELDNMIKELS